MKNKMLIVAATAALCATPAFAQDQKGTITGPRAEVVLGWDDVVANVDGESQAKGGFTYGGEVGYDIEMWPTFVIGGYAGIDGSTTKYCFAAGSERECVKAGRNITIGARAGTRFGQDSLVYLKGGYSNGQIRDRYTDTAFPEDNLDLRKNMDGFHVGGGVQLGMGHGLYVKGEYTFTQYSTYNLAGYDARIDRHRLTGGVGFHF